MSAYRVYWIDQSLSQPTLNSEKISGTSGRLINLAVGHRYAIAIASINAYGEGAPNGAPEAIVGAGVPNPPTLLSAYVASATEVDLTWTAVSGAAGYWIMARDAVAGGVFGEYPFELPFDWTSWRAGLLVNGADRYEFCVEAANGSVKSAPSNCLRATIRPPSVALSTPIHRQPVTGMSGELRLRELVNFQSLYRYQYSSPE